MKIKILCGQMEVTAGRPDVNLPKILEMIAQSKAQAADILLLPEMCLPGYLIGDLWEQQSFIDDCLFYAQEIVKASAGLCILFGSVATDSDRLNEDGRERKYNAAFACQDGVLLKGYLEHDYIIKNSMPNYREFDDSRYFHSLRKLCAEENAKVEDVLQPLEVTIRGEKIKLGVMLCEDGWTENYFLNVPQTLAKNGAQILCNLSCSPYTLHKNRKRNQVFSKQAQAAGVPLFYCNNVGIQNNGKNIFTYDGSSSVYNAQGELITTAPMYKEILLACEWDSTTGAITSAQGLPPARTEAQAIYEALKYGTTKFLAQCGITKMTIGLSGGIDSAVTAAMYVDILGPENVLLLNLPSAYNSATTRNLAERLAKAAGANYAVLPITESVEHTAEQLTQTPITCHATGKTFNLELNGLVRENIQARDRGARLIAGAAAAFGGALSCNANKAETSIGYATFYGDIIGLMAMLGDLWKHQVYALGQYLNNEIFQREVIPEEIFTIRPSAELSDAQTVGNGGDPLHYPYHDYLLRAFVENWHKTSPADILKLYAQGTDVLARELGCEEAAILTACPTPQAFVSDLERCWKLFAGFAVAKRIQAPPILAISKRAFGYDHREAQLSPYFSREYYQLKTELLK